VTLLRFWLEAGAGLASDVPGEPARKNTAAGGVVSSTSKEVCEFHTSTAITSLRWTVYSEEYKPLKFSTVMDVLDHLTVQVIPSNPKPWFKCVEQAFHLDGGVAVWKP
jgi:hypothetical protein